MEHVRKETMEYSKEIKADIDDRVHRVRLGVQLDYTTAASGDYTLEENDEIALMPIGIRTSILVIRAHLSAMAKIMVTSGITDWDTLGKIMVQELEKEVMELERRMGDRMDRGVEIL